jgi:hypothetical protein
MLVLTSHGPRREPGVRAKGDAIIRADRLADGLVLAEIVPNTQPIAPSRFKPFCLRELTELDFDASSGAWRLEQVWLVLSLRPKALATTRPVRIPGTSTGRVDGVAQQTASRRTPLGRALSSSPLLLTSDLSA